VKPAATAEARPDPASADVLAAPALPPAWSAPPKKAAEPAKKVEFASDVPAAKPAAARPPADDRQPIMTTGVAYFEDADLPEPPAPKLPPAALRLKGRVEAACRGQAREVQVVVTADGMHVHVILKPGASHDEVARRVLRLPDMKAPGVQLNIEVAP
jgi:hypothetical protein